MASFVELTKRFVRPPFHAAVFSSVFFLVVIPLMTFLVPPEHPLRPTDATLLLLGKFACYGMVAIAVGLIWGFAGILSLGHGVFFALGGYAMGMHLMLSVGEAGVYRSKLPDFMVFLDWKELPWFWHGFDQLWFAMLMALFVPSFLAWCLGYLTFRSRIGGVYFSLITQALTFATMLLFFRNETGLGGNNGLTNFKVLYGYPLASSTTKLALYWMAVTALALVYIGVNLIVKSRFGTILRATRDAEAKTRFCGYDTLRFKLLAWTLSGTICGLAGALYVPLVGIINPSEMQPSNSIEMVIWVAVGGRGTVLGPLLGALSVNAAKSYFTAAAPELWLFILGGMFVLVTLLLPNGLIGLGKKLQLVRRSRP
ncbi:MAG: urea ABC transporter permease subunit UrtC [Polyangiaceae bacterium]